MRAELIGQHGELRTRNVGKQQGRTAGLDDALTVAELWDLGAGHVSAVLNGGKYECLADNLRKLDGQP